MVMWSSLTPQSDQQPTTPATGATFSVMETAPTLVNLMDCGLGAHPLVNVSEHVKHLYKCYHEPNVFGLYKVVVAFNFTHRINGVAKLG